MKISNCFVCSQPTTSLIQHRLPSEEAARCCDVSSNVDAMLRVHYLVRIEPNKFVKMCRQCRRNYLNRPSFDELRCREHKGLCPLYYDFRSIKNEYLESILFLEKNNSCHDIGGFAPQINALLTSSDGKPFSSMRPNDTSFAKHCLCFPIGIPLFKALAML